MNISLYFDTQNSPFKDEDLTRTLFNIEGELEALLPVEVEILDNNQIHPTTACRIEFKSLVEMLSYNLNASYSIGAQIFYRSGEYCVIQIGTAVVQNKSREFLRDLIRHEIGHIFIGEAHSNDRKSIMYKSTLPGNKYIFTNNDLRKIKISMRVKDE